METTRTAPLPPTLAVGEDEASIVILDQTELPFRVVTRRLDTVSAVAEAIRAMRVRGAPLIGATAAYGVAIALRREASDEALAAATRELAATRPTAVNLAWALARMERQLLAVLPSERAGAAFALAAEIAEEDVAANAAIGRHGLGLIADIAERKQGEPVQILTHCNAGRLATVAWGTATAPIYLAHEAGIPVHVFVDETRPRLQGAGLTALELGAAGIPHTVIADNAGGHLMQHGAVDMVIVGADRVTACGDVANKIGTYLKALAARASGVPFYVAVPLSTIDLAIRDGLSEIPIEERSPKEVATILGKTVEGAITRVRILPEGTRCANPAFDVTPAGLVTGLITERGVIAATEAGIAAAFGAEAPAMASVANELT